MKAVLFIFTFNLIVCLSSCENDTKSEIKDTSANEATLANEAASANEVKEQVQEISSFNFIDKYKSDNFFKNDVNGKKISVTNLIVDGYEIDDNGDAKLYCMAYSPEKSLIYLSRNYIQVLGQYRSKSRLNEKGSHFLLDDKELSFVVDSAMLKSENGDTHWDYGANCENFFLIVLTNPKDIKELASYNGSVQDYNICKSFYTVQPYYKYSDLIDITGVFNVKSSIKSSVEHCCPQYAFEDCSFTKRKAD